MCRCVKNKKDEKGYFFLALQHVEQSSFTICGKGRPSQVFGEQGNKGIYFRGTGGQRLNFEENRGTKTILGNREHRKQFSIFGEQGNKPIYFRGTKVTGTPREGLKRVCLYKLA